MFYVILMIVGFVNGLIGWLGYGNVGYCLGSYTVSIIAMIVCFIKFKPAK